MKKKPPPRRTFLDELQSVMKPDPYRLALEQEQTRQREKYEVQHQEDMRYINRLVPDPAPDWNEAIEKLRDGDPTDFFCLLPLLGHSLFDDAEVRAFSIERWFYQKDDADSVVAARARENLITMGKRLAFVGSGPIATGSLEANREKRKKANKETKKTRDASVRTEVATLRDALTAYSEESVRSRSLKENQVRPALVNRAQQMYTAALQSKKATEQKAAEPFRQWAKKAYGIGIKKQ
jgi:hypothetical protein